MKLRYKTKVEYNHSQYKNDTYRYRAVIKTKLLFGHWRTCFTVHGKTPEELIDNTNKFLSDFYEDKQFHKSTYTLTDMFKDLWWNIKTTYFDFGYIRSTKKYQSKFFIPLKKVWYFGYPKFYIKKATKISKNIFKGKFNRFLIKHFNVYFYKTTAAQTLPFLPMYRNKINPLFAVYSFYVGWKDKYDTPRFETHPQFSIWFLRMIGFGYLLVPDFKKYSPNIPEDEYGYYVDSYWEQALWTDQYSDKDIVKARETWPWQTRNDDGEYVSSWREDFLLEEYRL